MSVRDGAGAFSFHCKHILENGEMYTTNVQMRRTTTVQSVNQITHPKFEYGIYFGGLLLLLSSPETSRRTF